MTGHSISSCLYLEHNWSDNHIGRQFLLILPIKDICERSPSSAETTADNLEENDENSRKSPLNHGHSGGSDPLALLDLLPAGWSGVWFRQRWALRLRFIAAILDKILGNIYSRNTYERTDTVYYRMTYVVPFLHRHRHRRIISSPKSRWFRLFLYSRKLSLDLFINSGDNSRHKSRQSARNCGETKTQRHGSLNLKVDKHGLVYFVSI